MTNNEVKTVSEVNSIIKKRLEVGNQELIVTGEVSNFYLAQSKHWYFTIKDMNAEIKCIMFYRDNQYLQIKPQNGDLLKFRCLLSMYEAKGYCQLLIKSISKTGQGLMQQKFEALKTKLAQEGVFCQTRKQPIPPVYTAGIITSNSGAAIQDIIKTLNRRAPYIAIKIFDVTVQGSQSATQVQNAIQLANDSHQDLDVLIVARGGGGWEDLESFNTEIVARAIFASKIPVISAIGHETDITIADLVADLRAATPSVAAELISTSKLEINAKLIQYQKDLTSKIKHKINSEQIQINSMRQVIKALHPKTKIQDLQAKSQRQLMQLVNLLNQELQSQQIKLQQQDRRAIQNSPTGKISVLKNNTNMLQYKIIKISQNLLKEKSNQLTQQSKYLNSINPKSILSKGFALITKNKAIVKSSKSLIEQDTISIEMQDGSVRAVVTN